MEKSWQQINAEIDTMHAHQDFTEKLICVLIGVTVILGLVGAPKGLTLLWLIPTLGYMLGRYNIENLRGTMRDYWVPALGSQAILAFIVGVPLLIRFGI